MERAWVIGAWGLVVVLAAWLRFEDLGARPFHADEATGARITAARMSGEGGRFDPKHYHGPVLGDAAVVACWLGGENGWRAMTKVGLRRVTAVVGVCVVLLPFFWRRRVGDVAAVMAGGLLAVSPLLVYYSRMFIHEMLLVLAGGAVLACFAGGGRPRWVWAGVCFGLMYAVKETFVISVLAWGVALVATLLCQREWRERERWGALVSEYGKPFLVMVAVAAVVAMVFYTRMFRYPEGGWDAVKTFFVYETVDGHDKPWWWYGAWFAWPQKAAGMWWYECVVVWLAVVVFIATWLTRRAPVEVRNWLRFLGFSVVGHGVIYSVFGYKTPWLMCMPWLHVCMLAGFGVVLLPSRGWLMAGVAVTGVGMLWPLSKLAARAAGRFASDARNPYAYVPTRPDVERLEDFLNQLRPMAEEDVVAVVGSDYWPLPWYLRSFSQVGYWVEPPEGLKDFPFVLATQDAVDQAGAELEKSHTLLPRGLRAEVPVWLMVRNDVWKRWMGKEP